jgi:hypothetical protein
MDMARTTIVFGILLVLLGVIGYWGSAPAEDDAAISAEAVTAGGASPAGETAKRSVTALIPACVGAILLLCGLIALNEKLRMHAMHAAVVVGLLGAIAGFGRGAMGVGKFLSNDPELNRRAFVFVWLMAILCTIFVVLSVRSFIEARKRRQLEESVGAKN